MSAGGEKPYDATPTRRERARREGNVARSSEAGAIAAFAGAALATAAIVPIFGAAVAHLMRVVARDPEVRVPPECFAVLGVAALPAVAAAACATLVHALQGGGLRVAGIKCDLSRLNPKAGLARMFGGEAVVSGLRATLTLVIVSLALVPLFLTLVGRAALTRGPFGAAAAAWSAAEHAAMAALLVGAVFAGADYALARRRWLRGLKMTLEELKRDRKENDGDPQTRSRRTTMHRALVRGALARVREASFVVVNPTHVAIAIRYAPPAVPLPEILVRAAGAGALRVRALACDLRIPLVENVALARSLYATGTAGRPIPRDTYVAVAQIIAELNHAGLLT